MRTATVARRCRRGGGTEGGRDADAALAHDWPARNMAGVTVNHLKLGGGGAEKNRLESSFERLTT